MPPTITRERPDSPDARVLIDELSAYLTPLSPPESQHGYSIEKLLERNVDFFVVRVEGEPAGCGGIEFFGEEYGELKRMYVRPNLRGQGLGKLIVEHLIQQASGRGVPLVRLETGSFMQDAIRLYERAGFYRILPFGDYKEDPLSTFFEKRI
jgi:GNAT superfamily N-acetyltransferase